MLDLTKPLRLKQSKEPVVLKRLTGPRRDSFGEPHWAAVFNREGDNRVYMVGLDALDEHVENAPELPGPLHTESLTLVYDSKHVRPVAVKAERTYSSLDRCDVRRIHEWLGRVLEATP